MGTDGDVVVALEDREVVGKGEGVGIHVVDT